MKKMHDYAHRYRGYWSEGGRCRIRIYRGGGEPPVVVCSQLPDNTNTSVTNMAEYLAAEVIKGHSLPAPPVWVEHYPEHEGRTGEYSLVRFSSWEAEEVLLGGVRRRRIGSPRWSHLSPEEAEGLTGAGRVALRRQRSRAEPGSSQVRRKGRPRLTPGGAST